MIQTSLGDDYITGLELKQRMDQARARVFGRLIGFHMKRYVRYRKILPSLARYHRMEALDLKRLEQLKHMTYRTSRHPFPHVQ